MTLLSNQFVRFVLIGIVNTIFGYSLFVFLLYIGLHYTLAVLIGTIIGVLFNFKTTGNFVFNSKENKLLIKFICVYGIIYLLNISSLYIFELFQINLYIAGAILIIPMALISYVLNKKIVFKH